MRQLSLVKQFSVLLTVAVFFTWVEGSWKVSKAQSHGKVSGRLVAASGPLSSGTIAFFHTEKGSDPADRAILRIPERTALVDAQGRFAVHIQYGSYYLGYFPDQQKIYPGLPDMNFKASLAGVSKAERYTLHVGSPMIDTGDISFFPVEKADISTSFTVSGTVSTDKGKPLAGITVVAKEEMNTFRPQYISRKTDKSGMYSLTLPPGSYYLFARHGLKSFGRPVTGEYFGILGVKGPAGEFGWFPINKDQDISLSGEAGQVINDADITVFRIPDPTAQEQVLRSKGKEKK